MIISTSRYALGPEKMLGLQSTIDSMFCGTDNYAIFVATGILIRMYVCSSLVHIKYVLS